MPGMDGFEVAELLSGNLLTRDIPIIFLSAVNTDKRFITKTYSSGAIDYITKPIDADILLLKVKPFHRLYEQNRELISTQLKFKQDIEFRKKAQVQGKAKEPDGILAAVLPVAFTAWKLMLTGRQPLEPELRIARTGTADYRFHLPRVLPVVEHAEVVKWVGTFTDIDEQKQVLKRKDEFLSIASHELKTPLTSIKAYVQLLDKVIAVTEPAQNFIDRPLLQVNKLDSLINDLLDISKIENGKLRVDLEPLIFGDVLSSTLEMLAGTQ
jgi:signal transduction histidine kinase